jgi:hypothetical protein
VIRDRHRQKALGPLEDSLRDILAARGSAARANEILAWLESRAARIVPAENPRAALALSVRQGLT